MEKTIENEWKTMSRLAMTAWVLVGVGIACVIAGWRFLPALHLCIRLSEGEVLGIVLFVALWIAGLCASGHRGAHEEKVRLGNLPRHPRLFRGEEPRATVRPSRGATP
ncbi:MAG: hypothetical protein ACLTEX_01380 [Eggerthella lenta]